MNNKTFQRFFKNIIFVLILCTFLSACGTNSNVSSLESISNFDDSEKMAMEKLDKLSWIDINSDEILGYANDLVSGYLCIGDSVDDKPEYNINDIYDLDWNMQVGSIPNTYQLYLQALNPVCFLAGAYNITGNEKYMELAWEFFESWCTYQENDSLTKDNVYVWDSHGMAMRTENLIVFSLIGLKNGYFDSGQLDELNKVLKIHGDYLSNDEYYYYNHNHGVLQDRALLALAYYFDNELSEKWIEHAKQRLEEQWNFEFTNEMVSTENSFGYHVFNKNLYTNIMEYLNKNNDDWGIEKLEKLKIAEDVIGWMVKPNGNSASFGESGVTVYNKTTGREDGVLRYLTSKGVEGIKPEENSVVYPDAGYYIGKEYWNPDESNLENITFEDSSWILFKTGFLSVVHKQDDDTSFEFYAKGHDIFVDPGFFGYVSNDLRAYLTSTSAHNMVTVDNKTYNAKKLEPGNAGIEYYDVNNDKPYDYVVGYNNLNDGVKLKRHLAYLGESIFIYDESDSETTHTYKQNFQCGPEIEVINQSDTEVLLKLADTGYFVKIKQLNENTKCEVLKGAEGTPYGQYSPKTGTVEYIDTVRFTNVSENLNLATLITIEDENGTCIDFNSFSWDDENKVFSFENKDGFNKLELLIN